ncbi:hypothetical protein IKD82_02885 [Candidatus Saccharibacteria bacterium]|nr:hypothetical protein [Candidatus Saccharibacteria bacterium]
MIKKFKLLLLTLLLITPIISFIATPVFAEGDNYVPSREGEACQGFLGMTSWDCNVNISDQETLKSGIWTIVANIATDITIIAAYLALGYVIYGGYLYIFSGGESGKVATGKKTLAQAFIGLAITMSATAIMSTIRIVLIGSGNLANCATGGCTTPDILALNTIHWFIGMAGIVSAIFIVYGGISYTTSAGDASKLQKAKNIIINALIGLAIVALAEMITAFVSNAIRDANGPSSDSQEALIIKTNTLPISTNLNNYKENYVQKLS